MTSGVIVDVILGLMAAEAVVLIAYRIVTGRGLAALDVAISIAAGACLLLAMRAALAGGTAAELAGFLLGAFGFHVSDLYRRWPRA
jgi:hypothetical protein